MNILIFTHSFLPLRGGLEKIISRLAFELVKRNHKIGLVACRIDPRWPEIEEVNGVSIHRFRNMRSMLSILSRAGRELRPDVIWICEAHKKNLIVAAYARLKLDSRVMLSLLGTSAETASPLTKYVLGLFSERIVALSKYCLKSYGYFPERAHVVYPGVDSVRPSDSAAGAGAGKVVLTVCRVVRRKGLETLLKGAMLLPDVQFKVVGDTSLDRSYFAETQMLMRQLGVQNVQFLGRCSDGELADLYRSSSLFALPTTHEMFGLVFLEAMAAGLPIVSTAVAAVPEIVSNDVGILVNPNDHEAFASAIRELLNNEAKRQAMAERALARASAFSWPTVVNSYEEILLSLGRG